MGVAGCVEPVIAGDQRSPPFGLALEAERLEQPHRGQVAQVEVGDDPVDTELAEEPGDDGVDGLGGEALMLVLGGQRVADGGGLAVGIEVDGYVAHERAVDGDGDLQPLAANRPVDLVQGGDEACRLGQRVRRLPALKAGHIRVRPIGRERRCVGRLERAQAKAGRRERQERGHPAQRRYHRHMKVRVDAEKCQGHNRCYALAPELFDVDDYGQAVVIGDGTVTPELEEKARLAVANCPEFAISIDEQA